LDLSFKLFLYFTVLGLLVDAETPFIDFVTSLIPSKRRYEIKATLENYAEGILTSQFESTIYQAVFTLVILDAFKVEYTFLYCVAAAFFRFVPCVSTLAVGFAAALQKWLFGAELFGAVALVCVYTFVDGKLSTDVYNKKLN
jgi:predicted PurR-regulated permease PerM